MVAVVVVRQTVATGGVDVGYVGVTAGHEHGQVERGVADRSAVVGVTGEVAVGVVLQGLSVGLQGGMRARAARVGTVAIGNGTHTPGAAGGGVFADQVPVRRVSVLGCAAVWTETGVSAGDFVKEWVIKTIL